jgi:hypothetical protein
MADRGIKQYRISPSDMPPISSQYEGYDLRYRVISEDRNRTSHWSPIQLIKPEYTFVPGDIQFHKAGDTANLVWDAVTITKIDNLKTYVIRKALGYDVWVRWDRGSGDGDWLYDARYETTSFSIPIPSEYTVNGVVQPSPPNRVSFEVYLNGYPIERGDGIPLDAGTPFLKMYEIYNQTV